MERFRVWINGSFGHYHAVRKSAFLGVFESRAAAVMAGEGRKSEWEKEGSWEENWEGEPVFRSVWHEVEYWIESAPSAAEVSHGA
jgi:hypothetical protein